MGGQSVRGATVQGGFNWQPGAGRPIYPEPVADTENQRLVREAAAKLLDGAVPALEREGVLPPSPYHVHLSVGYDYSGYTVRAVPEHDEFERVLEAAYPERFGEHLALGHRQFAGQYLFTFLERCISECVNRGEPIASGSSGSLRATSELIEALDGGEFEVAACRHVAHLTTVKQQPLELLGVRIVPVDGPREAEREITRLLPRLMSASTKDLPFIYSPPHALLVAQGVGTDQTEQGVALSARIERFLLAVRLLRSASTASLYEVRGATTTIGRYGPQLMASPTGFISRIRRTAELSTADGPGLEQIADLVDSVDRTMDGLTVSPSVLALNKYNRSYLEARWYEHLVDLSTALEAALSGTDQTDVTLRIKHRSAALLATANDPPRHIFEDVGILYELRSKLVHGATLTQKQFEKQVRRLNAERSLHAGPVEPPVVNAIAKVPDEFGELLDRAVDRLRDIVRRAILARICLAAGDKPLWPLTGTSPVDSILADDGLRRQWRDTWQTMLSEGGSGMATEKAPRAASWLSRS